MDICNHKEMRMTCDIDDCDTSPDRCNKENCMAYSDTPAHTCNNNKQVKNLSGVMKDINRQCVSLNAQINEIKKEWARNAMTDKEASRLLVLIGKLTSIRDRLDNLLCGVYE